MILIVGNLITVLLRYTLMALTFPNGVVYNDLEKDDASLYGLDFWIDGLHYKGDFVKGKFSGEITEEAGEYTFGIIWSYKDGKLISEVGIDDEGLIVS